MDISHLSNQELWHFAIHCAESGRHDHAIIYLKQLIKIDINNIDALILISSEYAEIKMFDESLLHLNKCKLLTNSPLPKFQICLVLVVQNKQNELNLGLKELMELDKDNAFYHYASILNVLNQDLLIKLKLISMMQEVVKIKMNLLKKTYSQYIKAYSLKTLI